MRIDRDAEVTLGDGVVVIRQHNSSSATVAQVLGERVRDGIQYLYLDRLVHFGRGVGLNGWHASGAISTVLSRPVPASPV
ncbi:MAG: hypothetical protein AzoDbin1_04748 [Azoarcus sp.]|nr:hypothetical protein [Azoarcus sp.]